MNLAITESKLAKQKNGLKAIGLIGCKDKASHCLGESLRNKFDKYFPAFCRQKKPDVKIQGFPAESSILKKFKRTISLCR